MYIYKNNDAVPWSRCVATVGFFDGVHAGHRFLLDKLQLQAQAEQFISVVITFDEHPRKVLNSDYQPKLLNTLDEKLELLEKSGVDACVALHFTKELSRLSAKTFLEDVLAKRYHVKTLFVGHDHRFGHNREESFEDYKLYGEKMGIQMVHAEKYSSEQTAHLSSSEIRKALRQGDIAGANAMLTYPYSITGHIVKGNQIGQKMGFPTANIQPDDKNKVVPSVGVYAVNVVYHGVTYKGMLNIGHRPTLQNDNDVKIEVNIIDFDQDIYNKTIKVEFVKYLRDEIKFKSMDELRTQLQKDRKIVENLK